MKTVSFIWALMVTVCAIGMLYGAIVTPSPVQGVWTCLCVCMVLASGYACVSIWKEKD